MIVKHKSRRMLAAAMVSELFDNNTWINNNVNGRGKDKMTEKENRKLLNPAIMAYVKRKVFEVHPPDKITELESDWQVCIVKN